MKTHTIRNFIPYLFTRSLIHINPSIFYYFKDTGKYCFGVEDTLRALELGSVETLICWENLDIQRYVLKNHASSLTTTVLHLTPEQEKDKSHFTDKEVKKKNFVVIVEQI